MVLETLLSEGGAPFYCGGYNQYYKDECYKYDAALDDWSTSGYITGYRRSAGYGSSESWGLVMAGGRSCCNGDSSFTISTVETTKNGETFGSLPDIPEEDEHSCLVIIDDDRIFMCGGVRGSSLSYIFSQSANSWER